MVFFSRDWEVLCSFRGIFFVVRVVFSLVRAVRFRFVIWCVAFGFGCSGFVRRLGFWVVVSIVSRDGSRGAEVYIEL